MNKSFAVIAVLAVAMSSFASDSAAVRKLIEAKDKQFATAMKNKDVSWLVNTSTSDYTESMKDVKLNKEAALSKMKQLFAMSKSIKSVSSEITSFKMSGKNAIVVSKTHLVAIIAGAKGKPSTIDATNVAEETWTPVGKDYKIKSAKLISSALLLDGKPFKTGM